MAKSETAGFSPASETVMEAGLSIEAAKLETTTLEEMGNTLPVGIFHEGNRYTDFKLRPFTGELETDLEDLFEAKRQGVEKLNYTVRQFFPIAIDSIGGLPLRTFDSDPHRLIDRMALADAMQILLAIRLDYQGTRDIAIAADCPNCGHHCADKGTAREPYHDLGSLEIRYYRDLPAKPSFDVELEDGFTVAGELIKKIRMQPLRFFQLKDMTNPSSGKSTNVNLLSCCIQGFPDSEGYRGAKAGFFGRDLYSRLVNSRRDKKIVFEALDKLQAGPVMQIDMDCPSCRYQWKEGLAWAHLPSFLYGTLTPAQ